MKKISSKYLFLVIVLFFLLLPSTFAVTLRETTDVKDGYGTIEPNTFIIGVTKFSGNEVITAGKAATAGANDAMLYALKNGTTSGYKTPVIYYYVDDNVGWFEFDSNNTAKAVTDKEVLEQLSSLDIYYVSNVEKKIEINYTANGEIDTASLPAGIEYKNNKLFANATLSKFTIQTINGKKIDYIMDDTTSIFVEDISSCYIVADGIITDYDKTCSSNIIIPTNIDGQDIVGIGENAFDGKNLESVIIPSTIMIINSNAFNDNSNLSVTIKEKYDINDFTEYSDTAFDEDVTIMFDNKLTRALKHIPDEYTIKVYSGLDLETLTEEWKFENLVATKLSREMSNNPNSSSIIFMGDTNEGFYYDDRVAKGKVLIHINECENNICDVELYNGDSYFDGKTVTKKITINLEKTGNILDKAYVDNAVANIEEDTSEFGQQIKESLKLDFVTRRRYLEDFEDDYDLEYIYSAHSGSDGSLSEEDDVYFYYGYGNLYVFKDGILYENKLNLPVIRTVNGYDGLTILPSDYNDIGLYIEAALEKFEERTGITDYTIKLNDNGDMYYTYNSGTRRYYNIELFDNEYLEYWTISTSEIVEDIYDNNGNTSETCFTISDGTITEYDGKCGANVKIPNSINGQMVTKIGSSAFQWMELQSIVLPETLIEIGDYAFEYNNLKEIVLPNSLVTIGSYAFTYNELESVIIPDAVETIEYGTFRNNKLKTVTLGNGLELIESDTFSYNEIINIKISNSIKEFGSSAFSNNKIEELIIPNNVEKIGSFAFENNNIKSLSLSDSLKEIGNGSFNNNQLSDEDAFIYNRIYDYSINKSTEDITYVVSYGGANRDNIKIPSTVTTIGNYAFSNLGLKNIEIPYGIEEIGHYAFSNNKLTEISVPDTVTRHYGDMFSDNEFEGDNCFIYTRDKDGNIDYTTLAAYSNNNSELGILQIPSRVKKIWSSAFSDYSNVDELIIPYGVEEIGGYAFSGLRLKSTVSIPKSVTYIGENAFSNYSESISDIDRFVYARNEDGIIDKTVLMAYAGYINQDLSIPEGIKEIRENVFRNKTNYEYNEENRIIIKLPGTLKKIGDYAFADNYYGLKNIVLNNGLEEIGKNSFEHNSFKEIIIPSSVKIIGESAFIYNYELESITLNEGLEKIDTAAFAWSNISTLSIPSTIKYIGDESFYSSSIINNVYIYGKNSIDDFDYFGDCIISENIEFINE